MFKSNLAKPMLVALAACAASVAFNGAVFAADDAQTQALKDQMRVMQQQMQQLQQQIDSMYPRGSGGTAARARRRPPAGKAKEAENVAPGEEVRHVHEGLLRHARCIRRLHDQGHRQHGRLPLGLCYRRAGQPVRHYGTAEGGAVRQGRLAQHDVEQRLEHRLPGHAPDRPTRMSTSSIRCPPPSTWSAAPGLQNTWTKSSNTVQGAIGLGDTFVGFQNHAWGRLRFGEMYMPYKTSTDRLNPFGTGLGNYAVVMGNTGGDNRVEFGTRMDDVVDYNSPTWGGFSFDVAVPVRPADRPEQQSDAARIPGLQRIEQPGQRQPVPELR